MTLRHPFAPPAAPSPSSDPFAWMAAATCATVDPELWHAEGSGGYTVIYAAKARAMCRWCPAARECWDYIQANDSVEAGIFAGMTRRDRRDVYAQMRAAA